MPNKRCLTDLRLTSICNDGIDTLAIPRQPKRVQDALPIYVTMQDPTPADISIIENAAEYSFWMESTMNPMPLLRNPSPLRLRRVGRWWLHFGIQTPPWLWQCYRRIPIMGSKGTAKAKWERERKTLPSKNHLAGTVCWIFDSLVLRRDFASLSFFFYFTSLSSFFCFTYFFVLLLFTLLVPYFPGSKYPSDLLRWKMIHLSSFIL